MNLQILPRKKTYGQKKRLREQVKENVLPYTNKGVIKFPWQIVIVTAKNP